MKDWLEVSLGWAKTPRGKRHYRDFSRPIPVQVAAGEPTPQAREFAELLAAGRRVIWYPIRPVPKPRMTRSDRWKKRPCVIAYRAFKDQCREGCVSLPMSGGTVIFCLPIPKMSKIKAAAMESTAHMKGNSDIDNLLKGLLDAVLAQDGGVSSVSTHKIWSSKPGFFIIWPRLESDATAAREVC